jgi:hypothetical protein
MVEWTTTGAVSRPSTWLKTLATGRPRPINQPVRMRQDLCWPFDGTGHGPSASRPARMSRAARSTSPVTA